MLKAAATLVRPQNRSFIMRIAQIIPTVALVAGLAVSGTAQAHPKLLSTSPAANALVAGPNKLQLKFSEKLIGSVTSADVFMTGMPGNVRHKPTKMNGFTGALGSDGKTLTLTRPRALPTGTYHVDWHAVAVDTHRVSGTFNFAVK